MISRIALGATLLASLLGTSAPALAAELLPAGFAPGTLWISKTNLAAGDNAIFYTVLYNSSSGTVAGNVVFTLDNAALGTQHVSLAAGASQIVSLPWAATTGSHTALATFESDASSSLLAGTTTSTLALTVAAPPPPSPAVAAAASAASGVLGAVQSARTAAIDGIQKILAADSTANASSTGSKGEVLGVSDYRAPKASTEPALAASAGASGLFSSLWHGFLRVLLYILQSNILFWLTLALAAYVVLRVVLIMLSERRR